MDLKRTKVEPIPCLVINLDRRPDRWAKVQQEIPKFLGEEPFERFSAIDLGSGLGLIKSYQAIFEKYKDYDKVMVFEDDVEFYPNARENWENGLKEVPDNWVSILGGVSTAKLYSSVTPRVYKMRRFCGTQMGIYKPIPMLDIIQRILNFNHRMPNIDVMMGPLTHVYTILPSVSYQADGKSDVITIGTNMRNGLKQRFDVAQSIMQKNPRIAKFALSTDEQEWASTKPLIHRFIHKTYDWFQKVPVSNTIGTSYVNILREHISWQRAIIIHNNVYFNWEANMNWSNAMKELEELDDWDIVVGGVTWAKHPQKITNHIYQIKEFKGMTLAMVKPQKVLPILESYTGNVTLETYLGKHLKVFVVVPFAAHAKNNRGDYIRYEREIVKTPTTIKAFPIVVINLDRRKDRLNYMKKELTKFLRPNETFERFAAIDRGNPNGLVLSYIAILEKYKDCDSVMLFEDDVKFLPNARQNWDLGMKDVPDDWDVVVSGVSGARNPVKITNRVVKVQHFGGTQMILVRPKKVVEIAKKYIQEKMCPKAYGKCSQAQGFDRVLGDNLNAYAILPFTSSQLPDVSDIEHIHIDYNRCFQRYEQFLQKIPLFKK